MKYIDTKLEIVKAETKDFKDGDELRKSYINKRIKESTQ